MRRESRQSGRPADPDVDPMVCGETPGHVGRGITGRPMHVRPTRDLRQRVAAAWSAVVRRDRHVAVGRPVRLYVDCDGGFAAATGVVARGVTNSLRLVRTPPCGFVART
jgi:hypothetical protein